MNGSETSRPAVAQGLVYYAGRMITRDEAARLRGKDKKPSPPEYHGRDPVDLEEAIALMHRECTGEISLSEQTKEAIMECQRVHLQKQEDAGPAPAAAASQVESLPSGILDEEPGPAMADPETGRHTQAAEAVSGEIDETQQRDKDPALIFLTRAIRHDSLKMILKGDTLDDITLMARARCEDAGGLLNDVEISAIVTDAQAAADRMATPWSRDTRDRLQAENLRPHARTDLGNTQRFLRRYSDQVRYCKELRQWYIWSGSSWVPDKEGRIMVMAVDAVRALYHEAASAPDDKARAALAAWAVQSEAMPRRDAIIKGACPYVAVPKEIFDTRPDLLNVQNGTLEFRKEVTLREHRPDDFNSKIAGVPYVPGSKCPLWENHLDLIFDKDPDLIGTVQEMAGYSLLGDNPDQVFFILYGSGKNGKSVTVSVLSEVFGDYALNVASDTLMVKSGERPRSDIARIRGARLVSANEGDEGARLSESWIKQLTGGGEPVTVRELYGKEFQFKPAAKIWFSTNHLPQIQGTEPAIWRRIWLVPFKVTIPDDRRDPRISEKLILEGPGILNWCLVGLQRYLTRGRLVMPDKIKVATAAYQTDSDIVGSFLDETCDLDNPMWDTSRSLLYQVYQGWCGDEKPLSPRGFARRLKEKGIVPGKTLHGARSWQGIRLKE